MAQIRLDGLDAVDAMFKDIGEIPFDVTAEALDAMATVAEKKVRASGEAMGVRGPESSVHILDKITHTKPKKTDSGGFKKEGFKSEGYQNKSQKEKWHNPK
mgnify:CR=1 FL=1